MSLGITLHFQPSKSGHWCQLYIVDAEGHCPSCGGSEVKRYYLDTPFHTVTTRLLDQLAATSEQHFTATCDQCDEELGSDCVSRSTLHFGFANGGGLLQHFRSEDEQCWQLSPHQSLDAQQILQWSPEDNIASQLVKSLDEQVIFDVFDRFCSPKELFRSMVKRKLHGHAQLTSGLRVLLPAIDEPDISETETAHPFPGDKPWGAPLPGRPWEWLSDLLEDASIDLTAAVVITDLDSVSAGIRHAVSQFPMETEIVEEADELIVQTEGERLAFSKREIAREAAQTLSDPGDIAHMELDRAIHALNWEESA
jgi:hypothetical protein